VRRGLIIGAAATLFVGGVVAESYLGSTRYTINGVSYDVPHKYEFMRQFSLPWLKYVKGLDADDPQSVALLFPASQIAGAVRGYHRTFHGYDSEVPADMVVTVTGGKEAREFPQDRVSMLKQEQQIRAEMGITKMIPDAETGTTRVVLMSGVDGDMEWDLMPADGKLPVNWRPPSCLGSRDVKGRATYDCTFWIDEHGLTFEFDLRQGDLKTADQIPSFVLRRMSRWRVN
jgi:hypothetical protein